MSQGNIPHGILASNIHFISHVGDHQKSDTDQDRLYTLAQHGFFLKLDFFRHYEAVGYCNERGVVEMMSKETTRVAKEDFVTYEGDTKL